MSTSRAFRAMTTASLAFRCHRNSRVSSTCARCSAADDADGDPNAAWDSDCCASASSPADHCTRPKSASMSDSSELDSTCDPSASRPVVPTPRMLPMPPPSSSRSPLAASLAATASSANQEHTSPVAVAFTAHVVSSGYGRRPGAASASSDVHS